MDRVQSYRISELQHVTVNQKSGKYMAVPTWDAINVIGMAAS